MYPNSLDSFITPTANQKLNNPSHSAIEAAQNIAIASIEAYLGTVNSLVTTSITYLLNNISPSSITGVIPITGGGTGQITASAAFNALAPGINLGDLIVHGPTGTGNVRFPAGTDGYFLRANSAVTAYGLEYIQSPAVYSVNADETINTWFTTEIVAPYRVTAGAGGGIPWVYSSSSGGIPLQNGVGATNAIPSGTNASWYAVIYNGTNYMKDMTLGTNQLLSFGTGFTSRIKVISAMYPGVATSGASFVVNFLGWGVAAGTYTTMGDITGTTDKRIGFAAYNGLLYAICCDGAAITATSLGAYTSVTQKLFQIIVTGTTKVEFYVNGTLATTILTNIPTSSNSTIVFSGHNDSGGGTCGFDFIGNINYAQKIA